MPRRRKASEKSDYEALKAASGWYLRAWRDRADLTLEELAEAAGSTKSLVSDLERGAKRYNRLHIDQFSRALDIPAGYLIDVNPFEMRDADPLLMTPPDFRKLPQSDQEAVADLVRSLLKRTN